MSDLTPAITTLADTLAAFDDLTSEDPVARFVAICAGVTAAAHALAGAVDAVCELVVAVGRLLRTLRRARARR